jgi:membrane-associated protease RseP (regulator of RpoE activity)
LQIPFTPVVFRATWFKDFMKNCAYCGRENKDDVIHCRECGTEEFEGLPKASLEPKIAICDHCGAKTETVGVFFKERRSFRSSILTLCPTCWQKRKNSTYKWLLLNKFIPLIFGIIFVYLLPNEWIGWFLLNVFVFDIALILSILPHELGHAYTAKFLGWRVFKIFIGYGKTVFKTKFLGFETEFRSFPLGGLVLAAPREKNNFAVKLFIFALAGPLTNAILVVLIYAALGGSLSGFNGINRHLIPLEMFLGANLFIVILSLWPREINTLFGKNASDGKQLLTIFKLKPERAAESHAGWFAVESALCQEKKQYNEALFWIEKGLKLYPENLQLQMAQGLIMIYLEKFQEARDCFLKILPRATDEHFLRPLTLNNIAYTNALIGGGDLLKEADQYSLEALNKLSWIPSVKGTRGTVLLELGKIEEAIPLLSETMQKHDNFGNKAQNACWLAIAEIRRGDRIGGKKYLEEARKFDSTCFLINRAQNVLDSTEMIR